jgi:hypothetical protein
MHTVMAGRPSAPVHMASESAAEQFIDTLNGWFARGSDLISCEKFTIANYPKPISRD